MLCFTHISNLTWRSVGDAGQLRADVAVFAGHHGDGGSGREGDSEGDPAVLPRQHRLGPAVVDKDLDGRLAQPAAAQEVVDLHLQEEGGAWRKRRREGVTADCITLFRYSGCFSTYCATPAVNQNKSFPSCCRSSCVDVGCTARKPQHFQSAAFPINLHGTLLTRVRRGGEWSGVADRINESIQT